MSGWIKLHRSITEHWLYTENRKFSKFEAWNDILLTVNYAPAKTIIKGKIIHINRGESILSLESWGKKWNWDKSSVKRFLELLKKDEMIELKNETVTTRLIVCKYDTYQSKESEVETQVQRRRNAGETQTKPIKEEKESKEEKRNKSFDIFWNIYDKKVDTKRCREKFLKLTDDEVSIILNVVKKYVDSKTDKQFLKNPLTWLNGKCWNDSIINSVETKISCEDEYMMNVMKQVNANKLL
jgi:hypothetical protein